MSIVIDCAIALVVAGDGLLFQYVVGSSSRTAAGRWPASSLVPSTVHPSGTKLRGAPLKAAGVGCTIGAVGFSVVPPLAPERFASSRTTRRETPSIVPNASRNHRL